MYRRPTCLRSLAIALCLALLVQAGCVRQQIKAQRRKSQAEYQAALASSGAPVAADQAARLKALRDQSIRDEWVERGYRVGNDRGAGDIPYTALGKGPLRGSWYLLFTLPRQTLAYYVGGDNPQRAAKRMLDPQSADARRTGIGDLIRWDFAQENPYVRRYRQMVKGETDALVRAASVRALNRARDPDARPLFIAALSDSSELVRLEAANALGNLPDPAAAAPLIAMVTRPEEDRDVRIAAADALRHYKSLEVTRALIPRLSEREFGIAWQAHQSLRQITGKDFGYNEANWLGYVSGPEKPFG